MAPLALDTSNVTNNPQTRSLTPQNPFSPGGSSHPSPSFGPYHGGPEHDINESQDLLLPPSESTRFQRYQDSPASSRRSSWSTDAGTADHLNPFGSMIDVNSTLGSRSGTPDLEPQAMKSLTEKFSITPYAGLIWDPRDKEDDDELHDPLKDDKERGCDIFTKRGAINVGGLAFITLGVLVLFIGYPIL